MDEEIFDALHTACAVTTRIPRHYYEGSLLIEPTSAVGLFKHRVIRFLRELEDWQSIEELLNRLEDDKP